MALQGMFFFVLMDQQLVNYGPGRLGCMFSFTQPTITELWIFKVEGISFIKKITNSFSSVNICYTLKLQFTLQISKPIIPGARALRALLHQMVYHMAMAQRQTFIRLMRRIKEAHYTALWSNITIDWIGMEKTTQMGSALF